MSIYKFLKWQILFMRAALVVTVLLLLPSVAFGIDNGAVTTATVYVYDSPKPAVSLVESDGTLVCSWDVKDNDEGDSFTAVVSWSKDGGPVNAERVDCGTLRHCAALGRPEPAVGENWECSVTVTDSYGATGAGSAEFRLTPLGFFGGLLRSILSFFKLG